MTDENRVVADLIHWLAGRDRAIQQQAEPKRYAITVCRDCHLGSCRGHLADEAVERYGLRINELEAARAASLETS